MVKKGIEDAMQIFAGNAGAGIGNFDFDRAVVRRRAHFDHAAGGHGIARIHEQVQKDLLQLVIRAQHRRQFLLQVPRHLHVRRPERVRDQGQRFFDHGVQIHFGKFRRAGARKIQQVVDDLAGAERLLDDFVDQLMPRIAAGQLLRQHLDVVGDHRQRRVHFVRDAGGQQAQRSELLGLHHLFFQAHPLRDVVHQDQPPDPVAGFSDQRRDRNVDHQVAAGAISHVKFVEAGDALVAGARRNFRHQVGRKHVFQLAAHGFMARHADQPLELRVPGFHRAVEIDRQHAHIERFDDIFREVLEPLDLHGFLFQRVIELRIIERDGQIPRDGEQKFHVFAGQKIAVDGLSRAQHGHGVVANLAGDKVVQVELFERLAHRGSGFARGAGRFIKQARDSRTASFRRPENSGPKAPHTAHPPIAPAGTCRDTLRLR